MFDRTFGHPIDIARGLIEILPAETRSRLSLLSDDAPDQAVLFERSAIDDRHRLLAQSLLEEARGLAHEHRFLHWEVAFPNVWREWLSAAPNGGFDAVVGNPRYVRQEQIRPFKPALRKAYAAFDGAADLYVYFYELGLRLLRPGGRLSYVVTNKWLRAGYAEELRGLLSERAWLEAVIDFGHAKRFFPGADVFPGVIVARRPDGSDEPEATEVCQIPRDVVGLDRVSQQVKDMAFPLPRAAFSKKAWALDRPEVAALMDKIRRAGVPLAELTGTKPYRGVLTGCNEAFLIDTPTRDALVAADPRCAEIIKPYLRGQDIERWQAPWRGLWMIFARRGIDIERYPSVLAHLQRYRKKLEPRPDDWLGGPSDWPGRKPGSYMWYELQDAVDYFEMFGNAKIIYNDITWTQRFALDDAEFYVNNTVYALPTADSWVLAVLNAPAGWWFAWRAAQHAKDEALRYFNTFVEMYPIPRPASPATEAAQHAVTRLVSVCRQTEQARTALLDWYRLTHEISKPGRPLLNPFTLTADRFVHEVQKARGKREPLSGAGVRNVQEEHAETVQPMQAAVREAEQLERRLSELVNEAYGLTPEDVRLMWDTAPPRMPLTERDAADGSEGEEAA